MLTAGLPELTSVKDIQYLKVRNPPPCCVFVGICEHKAQLELHSKCPQGTDKMAQMGGLPAAKSEDPSSVPGEN